MNTLMRTLFCSVAILLTPLANAALTANAAGDEITDSRTGLTWKRCIEGMSWNATSSSCTGAATTYTQAQALALAAGAWRLPNIKELASLTDLSRKNPAINTTAFPNTPFPATNSASVEDHWSSSLSVGQPGYSWYVSFSTGRVDAFAENTTMTVRLVK